MPCEAFLDVLLGLEALHELDNLEIGHINLWVLATLGGFRSQKEEGGKWVAAAGAGGWVVTKYFHLNWMDDGTDG
jgi:hypothetical protein